MASTQDIRQSYLDFYKKRNHSVIASASLLPENDPTTLFTGSGMQPMVPYLLGEEHPQGSRIADSQKCFRTQDIDEAGDNRHTTFFEMLGNWSLGDYFKAEQIPWMFSWLTDEVGLDPKNLYVTVFRGDETLGIARDTESVELWKNMFSEKGVEAKDVDHSERDGMQNGRIFYYDETKNWWSRSGITSRMPVGEPGGPDSEMFWDFGVELGLHDKSEFRDQHCHVNCDCGRFLEIGNNVFMEYMKTENGFKPLPKKNVDFGGGLERITAAANNEPDIFLLDVFEEARGLIEKKTGKIYGGEETYAFRVILDHIRASMFLIADGAVPSNKDQGYFTRRLIRRAVRFGAQLGVTDMFLKDIAPTIIDAYLENYTELKAKKNQIVDEISREEEKFRRTLVKGEKEFEKMFKDEKGVSGEDAFTLYSTYGFPLELTEEMVEEKGLKVDRETFKREFEKHKELSRAGSAQKFAGGLADHSKETVSLHTATHLLHQALRTVLGEHVTQRGSNITPKRLRFDFSHPEKMTNEQKTQVEEIVNAQIQKNLPVTQKMMTLEEAKATGAIGLFEDKYSSIGDQIKVYFIGEAPAGDVFSSEVCGGPHAESTAKLGTFRIKKEESASAGIRRIKAVLE
jgi:alanyl-tRNA synthetase